MGRNKQKWEETGRNKKKKEEKERNKNTKKKKRNNTKFTRMYTSLRCNTTLHVSIDIYNLFILFSLL